MNSLLAAMTLIAAGQFSYPPQMDWARVETYKTVGDTKLNFS